MPLCRAAWSKLQPFLSGRIAERLDPAVVGEASPVEHDPADTGLLAPGGDELAHLGGQGRRQGTLTQAGLLRRGGSQGAARIVVDDLGIDVAVGPEHRQPGPLGAAPYLAAHAEVPALPSPQFDRAHRPDPPALP